MFTLGLPRFTVNVKTSDMHATNLLLQDVNQMLWDIIYLLCSLLFYFNWVCLHY